jgi:hypothetical protein
MANASLVFQWRRLWLLMDRVVNGWLLEDGCGYARNWRRVMAKFVPMNDDSKQVKAPYFEDADARTAPNYSSKKTLDQARAEVANALSRLGGWIVRMDEGTFEEAGLKRFGFQVHYQYKGMNGLYDVVGLPIRKFSDGKKRQVLVQALLTLRDWLTAAYTMKVFSSDVDPLLGNLLTADGSGEQKKFNELIADRLNLTALPAPDVVVEVGE